MKASRTASLGVLGILTVMLSGCVPLYQHYYAPTGDGEVKGTRCGRTPNTIELRRDGVIIGGDVLGDFDQEWLRSHPFELSAYIQIFNGHRVKLITDDVQLFVNGSNQPVVVKSKDTLSCGTSECQVPIDTDVQGAIETAGSPGGDYHYPKTIRLSVPWDNAGAIPKEIRYLLPPISIDGKEPIVVQWTFTADSGLFIEPLNGC